jgi:acyl carrier protein
MRASQRLRRLVVARSSRAASDSLADSLADSTPLARPAITEQNAFVVIRDAVAAVLDVPAAGVTRETRLTEDLHADSLALVEIVELVEERLAERWPGLVPATFRLEDAGLEELQTVGDAVTFVVTSS